MLGKEANKPIDSTISKGQKHQTKKQLKWLKGKRNVCLG
jgi:hypothetical protein